MKQLGAVLLFLICAQQASATDYGDAAHRFNAREKAGLAGEWRAFLNSDDDPCYFLAQGNVAAFSFEAKINRIRFNDGTGPVRSATVRSIIAAEDTLVIALRDGRTWLFLDDAKKHLRSDSPPSGWGKAKDRLFY